ALPKYCIIRRSCFFHTLKVPQCLSLADIKCLPPQILFGTIIEPQEEYQENELIKYACDKGYKATPGTPKCTKNGWSIKPECEEVTCVLQFGIPGVHSTSPSGKNIFKPEESLTLTFAKGACGKLTLTNGFIQYSKDHDGAQRASYSCDTGYKAFDEKWWGVVTCQQGVWSHQPQCIRKNECGSLPNVKHGKQIQINEAHQDGQRLKIECDLGYKSRLSSIRCLNGQWETSVCERHRCNTPPEVENAVITSYSTDQELEQLVTFKCKEGLELHGHDTISCINSKWEQTPTCKQVTCVLEFGIPGLHSTSPIIDRSSHSLVVFHSLFPLNVAIGLRCDTPPKVENAIITSHSTELEMEQSVTFKCGEGFELHGHDTILCINSKWEQAPTCKREWKTRKKLFFRFFSYLTYLIYFVLLYISLFSWLNHHPLFLTKTL
uniref:Sushi domain-containing protein n=1 Tax=Electrophorus electricus TaxID=8005 RepID=A0AAY5EHV8_ELEEL